MAGNRERTYQINIRLNEQEYKAFLDGYEKSGLQSQREYILEMCLRGYLVKVDLSGLNKVAEELNRIGVNINQIAHKVNAAGGLSRLELKILQQNMATIYGIIKDEFIKYKKPESI